MFTFNKSISRYKAASIHMAMSACIAALVLTAMLTLWYPGPLFAAMGGKVILMLIVGVDVCLGPLVTLVVFDTRKKSLIYDLMIIAAVQLGALGYGIHTMYAARPVFTVFAERHFVVIPALNLDPKNLSEARIEEFRHLSLTGPRLAAINPPTDPDERAKIFSDPARVPFAYMPKYYVPYADKRKEALDASRPIADLKLEPEDSEKLAQFLRQSHHKAEELRCLSILIVFSSMTAIIDARSGDVVGILDISPSFSLPGSGPGKTPPQTQGGV